MNEQTITALNALTGAFYAKFGAAFSATREDPWPGWERVACVVGSSWGTCAGRVRVLDVGCGNYRFEEFLSKRFEDVDFSFVGLDYEPMPPCRGVNSIRGEVVAVSGDVIAGDIASALLHATQTPVVAGAPADLAVAFGLLHHVPTQERRARLLREMLQCVRPGGLVAVSFWEFAKVPALERKAAAATAAALSVCAAGVACPAGVADAERACVRKEDLEAGDYIVGWQDFSPEDGAMRYCHSFTSEEISQLSVAVGDIAEEMQHFFADGRTGDMNEYVMWRRREA